ncbi:MAG: DUF4118 domain-containing protein [Janthinobacterium lividum]
MLTEIKNARRWAPVGARPWLIAGGALLSASALRLMIQPLVGPLMPGTPFCIAAALIAYYCGMMPAFTIMLLGLGIADYLFVPPYAEIQVFDRSDLILVISYPVVTALVICLIERLRRAQFRAELIASVAESRYEMLLRADNERAVAKRALDETRRLVEYLPQHHAAISVIQISGRRDAQAGEIASSTGELMEFIPSSWLAALHPQDLQRMRHGMTPGSHLLRIDTSGDGYQQVDCVCEHFSTHAGDYQVLRIDRLARSIH